MKSFVAFLVYGSGKKEFVAWSDDPQLLSKWLALELFRIVCHSEEFQGRKGLPTEAMKKSILLENYQKACDLYQTQFSEEERKEYPEHYFQNVVERTEILPEWGDDLVTVLENSIHEYD